MTQAVKSCFVGAVLSMQGLWISGSGPEIDRALIKVSFQNKGEQNRGGSFLSNTRYLSMQRRQEAGDRSHPIAIGKGSNPASLCQLCNQIASQRCQIRQGSEINFLPEIR